MRLSRGVLRRAGLRAFLVTSPTNIRYLTDFELSAGAMLLLPKRALLFVDSRYRFEAEQKVRRGIAVRDIQDLPRAMAPLRKVGFEAEDITCAVFRFWKKKFPSTKCVPTEGVVAYFRRSKDPKELRAIRRAERITEELLRRIPSILRKGITERRVASQIQIWALELGADGPAFDPIVAFGTHSGNPHHHPTARALQKGHIVQVDIGAKLGGYCSDRSEVYFTGKPTPLQDRVYATLCKARDAATAAAKPGVAVASLDRLAREVLGREGFAEAFTHALGHGVGLEIHEGVSISEKSKDVLLPHEVITIEPGVYFPGRFGMRVEKMVYMA